MAAHDFVAFPDYVVEEKDSTVSALRRARVMSSDRDFVEEYIACQVWLLSGGWSVDEVIRRNMPLKSLFFRRNLWL
jgi:hypothetical protein